MSLRRGGWVGLRRGGWVGGRGVREPPLACCCSRFGADADDGLLMILDSIVAAAELDR